jgi:hypothetical protein
MVGNVLQKGVNAQNTRVIAYGMEGIKHEKNALIVVNNTMVYENRRGGAFFVNVQKVAEDFVPVIRNNLCVGKIPLTNSGKAEAVGNLLLKTVEEAGFVDAGKYDYHLKAGSPAIDKAVAFVTNATETALVPKFEYVHPCGMEKRPVVGGLDVVAFEFAGKGP